MTLDLNKIQHVQAIVLGAVLVIGLNASTIFWAYKTKTVPMWQVFSTLCALNPYFLKKFFIEGPGVLLIIIWMIIASVVAYIITPLIY